jgi:hypothetical protein
MMKYIVKPKNIYAATTVPRNRVDPDGIFPTEILAILSVMCMVSLDWSAVLYTGRSQIELNIPTQERRNPNFKALR